jgi:hypothetical protein
VVQAIRDFSEGCRRGLSIMAICEPCDQRRIFLCRDFEGYISPWAQIERLSWRCETCGAKSRYVRYMITDLLKPHQIQRWIPRPAMKRRYGVPTGR